MPDQTNAEYFRMRAADERARSRQATDPRSTAAHAELANRYEEMAERFGVKDEERRSIADLVPQAWWVQHPFRTLQAAWQYPAPSLDCNHKPAKTLLFLNPNDHVH